MLPEHPVDSAHDNLHEENVNAVMKKSRRNITIGDDKLRKDHDNLFIEVLKQEHPLLYDSIEYFHPDEFQFKHKSNMPICYDQVPVFLVLHLVYFQSMMLVYIRKFLFL